MLDTRVIAGRYRLSAELGRGGMGVVWLAFDELLHREVAVKEVHFPPGLPLDDRERLAGRTLREARAVAAVDTPSAVRVFDIVEQDGRPWIVMELVRGRTLTNVLQQRGWLPAGEVARIGLAVLDALEVAHNAGVLHRDVKPSNVLVGDDGRVALTDFGIATVDGDGTDTTSGVIVGSPSYVAPERLRGELSTPASDLWSLGATLWTAAEGQPPYSGESAVIVMSAVANSDPPTCSRCQTRLAALLRSMMDRDPALRPAAAQVRSALAAVLHDPAVAAAHDAPTVVLPTGFDRTTILESPVAERPPASETAPAAEPIAAEPIAAEGPALVRPAQVPPVARPIERRGHRRAWIAAGVAAAVVVAAVAAILLRDSGTGSSRGRSTSPRSSPHSASHSRSASAATLPTGWHRYTDPTLHWTIGVPPEWTRTADANGTRFSDPAGGRYLLVATRYPAGSSAVGAWRDSERSFRTAHSGYQRIRLERISVPGTRDAADWEFSYVDGVPLHALDHALIYGTRGYALYFQTHSDQWQSSQSLWQDFEKSFRHGSTGA